MSDFDDEPTTGPTAPDDEPAGASEPVDDWDDEVAAAPKAKKSKAKAPADGSDDDWDDDWDDDDEGRGNKRDLTLVYAIVAAAIVIVLAVVLTRPKDDPANSTATGGGTNNGAVTTTADPAPVKNWQGDVSDAVGDKGADAQARATSGPGVYIWTDFWGWHVRNNNAAEAKVTVAAPQVRVKTTDDYNDDDEKGDAPFSTSATITLPPGDGKTGQGFDLGGSESATFTVTIDGQNVPPADIKLGGAEGVADANPVTFIKG